MDDELSELMDRLLTKMKSIRVDRLATAHLLLIYFVQIHFLILPKRMKSPQYYNYLENATLFIKHFSRRYMRYEITKEGAKATSDFKRLLNEIVNSKTIGRGVYNSFTILQIIVRILDDFKNIFGRESFVDYFYDLSFSNNYAFSRRASHLLMHALLEEERKSCALEHERTTKIKDLLDFYDKNWKSLMSVHEEISFERFLFFHCISLLMSRRYFDLTFINKHRKHVGKAIQKFINSDGTKENTSSVTYLKERGYNNLKTALLELIHKGYKEADDPSHLCEWYTLATDRLLTDVCDMDPKELKPMLMEPKRDNYAIFTTPKLEEFATIYEKKGQEEFEKLVAAIKAGESPKLFGGDVMSYVPTHPSDEEDSEGEDEEWILDYDPEIGKEVYEDDSESEIDEFNEEDDHDDQQPEDGKDDAYASNNFSDQERSDEDRIINFNF